VAKVGITLRDRDNNSAKVTFYCAFATPIADAWSFALAVADRVGALSDALITSIDIAWRWTVDSPATPALTSSIERKLLLFMINADEDINGMIIPSPSDNWETIGSYAGIRLDLASAGALQWSAMLAALDLRTQDGRELGTVLAAGGLAL
jgi:hypothetical protein